MTVDPKIQQKAHDAMIAASSAEAKSLAAQHDWGVAMLKDLFDRHPQLEAITCESEYCYDDEGGYFLATSWSVAVGPGPNDEEVYAIQDELEDQIGSSLEAQAWTEVFGKTDSWGEARLTREQIEGMFRAQTGVA